MIDIRRELDQIRRTRSVTYLMPHASLDTTHAEGSGILSVGAETEAASSHVPQSTASPLRIIEDAPITLSLCEEELLHFWKRIEQLGSRRRLGQHRFARNFGLSFYFSGAHNSGFGPRAFASLNAAINMGRQDRDPFEYSFRQLNRRPSQEVEQIRSSQVIFHDW